MSLFDPTATKASYTLSTLRRIQMIERVTEQTKQLASNTRKRLEEALEQTTESREVESVCDELKMRMRLLREEVNKETAKLLTLQAKRDSLESQVSDSSNDMSSCFQQLKRERECYMEKKRRLGEDKEKLIKTNALLNVRRKQLISEITAIYPIQPCPANETDMMILGVCLPNSEKLTTKDESSVPVALGYVCHILVMLSKFFDVPLRYSIIFFGSRSSIYDHLNANLIDSDRMLPLFNRKSGRDRMYFNYGVFLVNRDIAQLQHYLFHAAPKELSKTLPNLHALLVDKLKLTDEDVANCDHRPITSDDSYLSREIEFLRNANGTNGLSLQHRLVVPSDKLTSRSLDGGLNTLDPSTETSPKIPQLSLLNSNQFSSSSNLGVKGGHPIPRRPRGDAPTYNYSNPELSKTNFSHYQNGTNNIAPSLSSGSPTSSTIDWIARQQFEDTQELSRDTSLSSSSQLHHKNDLSSPGH